MLLNCNWNSDKVRNILNHIESSQGFDSESKHNEIHIFFVLFVLLSEIEMWKFLEQFCFQSSLIQKVQNYQTLPFLQQIYFLFFLWRHLLCVSRYTFCRAFLTTLNELNDYAGQHEVIAENLTSQIITELTRYLQELKTERKSVRRF